MLQMKPIAIRGSYGVYIAYYLAERVHVSLTMRLREKDSWVDFPADPDNWLALATLHVRVWENNVTLLCSSVSQDRDEAWKNAKLIESTSKAFLFNEWYVKDYWTVSVVQPKGKA